MLPLHTHGIVAAPVPALLKVLGIAEALSGAYPPGKVAVDLRDGPEVDATALGAAGFAGIVTDGPVERHAVPVHVHSLRDGAVVAPGDVVRVRPGTGMVSNLFRRGANANTLFATERCNSRCLMCSQPPRDDNDGWRVREMLELVPLLDRDLPWLGMSGGEPTLLGDGLREVIGAVATHLPSTGLHILTNGRTFADPGALRWAAPGVGRTVWAVPLYSDVSWRHDHVVQAEGGFDQAVQGIYNLAEAGHRVEIRMVLHALTVPRLKPFAEFVWRNMPFVDHVALMGLEPMGYAKVNRDQLWLDPLDYASDLVDAAFHLHDRGIRTSIYNVPLCVLPRAAWPLAQQSISDWKNTFAPACGGCDVRGRCCGFFASAGEGWRSRGIKPVNGGHHGG